MNVWTRDGGGRWTPSGSDGSAAAELSPYLPVIEPGVSVTVTSTGRLTTLTWHDDVRAADMWLMVDAASKVPHEVRVLQGPTGWVVVVDYLSWNVPPDIEPPQDD